MELTPPEVRVLGSLIEKELTTPQYYPLTLNALLNACNQTSNRDPVVSYDAATVEAALTELRSKELTRIVHSVHNRATKYRHVIDEAYGLERPEVAVLGVLLLRGPQTPGELRARTERMVETSGSDEVEAVVESLATRPEPLVVRLPRQPGQKESRFAHLLGGEPPAVPAAAEAASVPSAGSPVSLRDEIAELRARVEALERRLDVAGS